MMRTRCIAATSLGVVLTYALTGGPAATSAAPAPVAEGRLFPYQEPGGGPDSLGFPDSLFGVPVTVRGHTFLFVADHGADASILTDAVLDSSGLPRMFANATRIVKLVRGHGVEPAPDSTATLVRVDGDTITEYWGDFDPPLLDSIRVGASLQQHVLFGDEWANDALGGFGGLLGRDILTQFDLELDGPRRRLRLYERAPRGPLPDGLAAADCLLAHVSRHSAASLRPVLPDTSGMSPEERRELRESMLAVERLAHQTELLVPVLVNGHPIDATFDSGTDRTFVNSTEARLLGLIPGRPSMRMVVDGADTTWLARGVTLRVGGRTLAPLPVVVSDAKFGGGDAARARPRMLLGWPHFGGQRLLLSYSTGRICLGAPRR